MPFNLKSHSFSRSSCTSICSFVVLQGTECCKVRLWATWRVLAEGGATMRGSASASPYCPSASARLGDRPVLDVCCEIRAIIRVRRVRIECNPVMTPIIDRECCADKPLKAELILKIDRIVVLARVCLIDQVVRTYDRWDR